MNYWIWIKSKWRNFVDWLLLNFGWCVGTLHVMRVYNNSFFRQGDIYRVNDIDDKYIIIYVLNDDGLICGKLNNFGLFIIFCRDKKYEFKRWRDRL